MSDGAGEGQIIWTFEAIMQLIFLGIAFIVVAIVLWFMIRNSVETGNLETDIFINRILYSENGISYQDPVTG